MKWISSRDWRGFTITVICLISVLELKGVHSQSIDCYTCTDQGEGGCLPENALNVTCSPDHNVCVEAIIAIKTSHNDHIVLKKGCGYGDSTRLDKTILFHGISLFIQLIQCNTSLCNTNMDLNKYQFLPDDNITHLANDEQCYSCIGKTDVDCSSTNPSVMQCYNTYSHCFDGNVTVSIDNDRTLIPVKSCTIRYRCAMQTLTYGSATFEIKGACCSGELCNKDLSNSTQLGEMPYLILLDNENKELTVKAVPPLWLAPTDMLTTDIMMTNEPVSSNSTMASLSQDDQSTNVATRPTYSLWVVLILVLLL